MSDFDFPYTPASHGDTAECHADKPRCGCVAKAYHAGKGRQDAAHRHAQDIGGTYTCERWDGDKYWVVRYPVDAPETGGDNE